MARIPFPFRDHYDPAAFTHLPDGFIPGLIEAYEDALLVEYKSGDIDVASYHEGLRTAYEGVLIDLLGLDEQVMAAYWGYPNPETRSRPEPYTDELPLLSDPDNWLITYEQVEQWSGQRLDAEGWERLNEAIPNSSIPEAIGDIVFAITDGAKED